MGFIQKIVVVSFIVLLSSAANADDIASPPIKLDGSYKMRITPVAGLNLTTMTETNNQEANLQSINSSGTTGAGYSAGVLVGFIFYPRWETEIGLIYTHQKFGYSFNDYPDNLVGDVNATFNTLQVPVVERYEFLPGLSAGGGVYYAHGIGSVSASADSSLNGGGSGSGSYEEANFKRNDFGLLFNLRGTAPIANGVSVLFDVRWLVGLLNLDSDGILDDATALRQVQFLGGLSFEF